MSLDELETKALNLPMEERAHLAARLISSLDEPSVQSEEEIQKLWLEEARGYTGMNKESHRAFPRMRLSAGPMPP